MAGTGWAQQAQPATDESLRRALDQLSGSYAIAQQQLREQAAALKTLTESLTIARTESEMFQKLWIQARVRAQTLGANLADSDAAAAQQQLMETLRKLSVTEFERQRFMQQLGRLVVVIESNGNVEAEVEATKYLIRLANKPAVPSNEVANASLESAKVLEVNLKLRLVVLNAGAQQGVRIGMPLMIFRGDRVVAELRVVEVRAKVCGAMIEKMDNNVTLQAGDTAQVTKS